MSLKSLIQITILLIIIVILGSVYFKYFSTNDIIVEETSENSIQNNKIKLNVEEKSNSNLTEQKSLDKQKNTQKESVKSDDKNKNSENKSISQTYNEDKKKKKKIKNIIKDIEYLTTDINGNKYKILATSGKTNPDNNNILDLKNVRGKITSKGRSTIYIVSDFAKYNSSNLSSEFYKNVIINYEDKEIKCDNFDINMETNIAIAYNNVVVTDPKSIMKAGVITLDIETKDITINPDSKINKVEIVTE